MSKVFIPRESSMRNLLLVSALYALETALFLGMMALYKKGDRVAGEFWGTTPGVALLGAVLVVMVSSAIIVSEYRKARRDRPRHFVLTVIMNVVTVTIIILAGEISVRIFSVRQSDGVFFGNTRLLPRQWSGVVEHLREIQETSLVPDSENNSHNSLRNSFIGHWIVPDELLGWTVSANRRTHDGSYSSGPDGIRTTQTGEALTTLPSTIRIAAIGDSYTMGFGVRHEDTWVHQLNKALGTQHQVLNFGVSGYGIGQVYLRYLRDVRPWHPDIVIFGVIEHDFFRTMAVYPFLSFSWDWPFEKPRFIIEKDRLKLLNTPLLNPAQIISTKSVRELPWLAYEPNFNPKDWEVYWYHSSYLVRFLLSRFPRYPLSTLEAAEDAMKNLNIAILRQFLSEASAQSSIPILVYFPSMQREFESSRPIRTLVQRTLLDAGIEYVDLTDCISKISPTQRFGPIARTHYSPQSNFKVAQCLQPIVLAYVYDRAIRKTTQTDH